MFFGQIAGGYHSAMAAFVVEESGHIGRLPAPPAYQQQGEAFAHLSRQFHVGAQQGQQVFARLNGAEVEEIARRQPQAAQNRLYVGLRHWPQTGAHAHVSARDLFRTQTQFMDEFLTDEFGDSQEVTTLGQPLMKVALVFRNAIRRVPFRIQKNRQIGYGDDGWQIGGQRDDVRLVVEVERDSATAVAQFGYEPFSGQRSG